MLAVCGNILDTLGSSLNALQGFLVLAVTLARHMRPAAVTVEMPGLLNMTEGLFRHLPHASSNGLPLNASEMALSRLINTTLLARRLGFDLIDERTSKCSHDAADINIHTNASSRQHVDEGTPFVAPSLDGGLGAFHESFRRIERFYHERVRAGHNRSTVFIQMMQRGRASCALPVFASTAHEVVEAMEFAEAVQPLFPSPQPCAYAYFRHPIVRVSNERFVKILQDGPVHVGPRYQVPLQLYAEAIGSALHAAGLSCLTINHPTKGGPASDAALTLQAAANTTLHPFQVRATSGPRSSDEREMHNFREARTAFESPLLLSEMGTLWSDWLLSKRMGEGRSSAVVAANDTRHPVTYLYSRVLHKSMQQSMHSRAYLPGPDLPHREPCLFFRGACVPDHEVFQIYRSCDPRAHSV